MWFLYVFLIFLCLSPVYICLLHVRYVPIPENVWMIDLCLLFLDTLIFWYCTSFEVFLRFCVCVWLNRRHIVLENQKENSFQKNLRFQYPPHTHPNCTPKIYIKDMHLRTESKKKLNFTWFFKIFCWHC